MVPFPFGKLLKLPNRLVELQYVDSAHEKHIWFVVVWVASSIDRSVQATDSL